MRYPAPPYGVPLLTWLLLGCAAKVDRIALDRFVARGLSVGDLGEACTLGAGLRHALAGLTSESNPPRRALVLAEATAALCAEREAWEADLGTARARRAVATGGDAAAVTDAVTNADRWHAEAAARFERAWSQAEGHWGPIGQDCPRIRAGDEIAWVVGLVAGTLALLHDKSAGSPLGVPTDRLGQVARGANCVDDAAWYHIPSALQAAAWATIPGSGPAGLDPWAKLEEAALAGETGGLRVARALEVRIAANAGRDDVLARGIRAHAAALSERASVADLALLDEYARWISLHESDLLWTAATGHRTPTFGQLPSDASPLPLTPEFDPFSP